MTKLQSSFIFIYQLGNATLKRELVIIKLKKINYKKKSSSFSHSTQSDIILNYNIYLLLSTYVDVMNIISIIG
jgi:hypothetical protein